MLGVPGQVLLCTDRILSENIKYWRDMRSLR